MVSFPTGRISWVAFLLLPMLMRPCLSYRRGLTVCFRRKYGPSASVITLFLNLILFSGLASMDLYNQHRIWPSAVLVGVNCSLCNWVTPWRSMQSHFVFKSGFFLYYVNFTHLSMHFLSYKITFLTDFWWESSGIITLLRTQQVHSKCWLVLK